ncbi:hypothetical protein D3C76_1581070 [compost metagenome]
MDGTIFSKKRPAPNVKNNGAARAPPMESQKKNMDSFLLCSALFLKPSIKFFAKASGVGGSSLCFLLSSNIFSTRFGKGRTLTAGPICNSGFY